MTQKTHDLNTTYKIGKINNSSITFELKGDGSLIPKLSVVGFSSAATGYVSAKDLRQIAKHLKKWAKGLEQHATPD